MANENKEYWNECGSLQRVKHNLIRNYINGWLPKLSQGPSAAGRVLYFDTHAGRGRHLDGALGSPLIALSTVLNHRAFANFSHTEIRFCFTEHDPENLAALQTELTAFQPLPKNVVVNCIGGDCFQVIDGIVNELRKSNASLAPSFVFCDPFGFSVPGQSLQQLMQYRGVEIFINIIWRELDMAVKQARNGHEGLAKRLDNVFAGNDWRQIDADNFDDRAEQCVQLFRKIVNAKWATYIRMLGKNDQTRYFLLHLSNHDAGRELMKECIWNSCPEGGYYARQKDDPRQQLLITPEPDLRPVEKWVLANLTIGPHRWRTLLEKTRAELWLPKHTNAVVKDLRNRNVLAATNFNGRFASTNNPLLTLKSEHGA